MCRPLEGLATHLFTTRGWPLGSSRDAWDDVARAVDVPLDRLIRARQVHGADVVVHRRGGTFTPLADTARPAADILMTDDRSCAAAIQTADCVALLIADSRTGAIAAAHAGWRGLAARVPAVAVERLGREFGSRSADLVAAIGPAIGACCYQVGDDVRARFESAGFSPTDLARWFSAEPAAPPGNPPMSSVITAQEVDRWFFDTWRSTRDQLEAAGVPSDQIFTAELCTASHAGAFCSYRRDGPPAGRIAAAIRSSPRRPSPRSPGDLRAD